MHGRKEKGDKRREEERQKGKSSHAPQTHVIKFPITVPKDCVPLHGRKEKWNGER